MASSRKRSRVTTGPSHSVGAYPASPENLLKLSQPHIDSFDYFLKTSIHDAVADIPAQEMKVGASDATLRWWVDSIWIGKPTKNEAGCASHNLTPRECRERGLVYGAPMKATISYELENGGTQTVTRSLGLLPIMVMSNHCRLKGMTGPQLANVFEEANEFGGYFVVNGIERVIRLLQVPRRDYAMAIERGSFKNRGPNYSDKGVTMRCARNDQTTQTVTLHYLNNGSATLRFSLRKQEFLVPMIILLKALSECTDREIYHRLLMGEDDNMFLAARLELLLQDGKQWGICTRAEALAFLGKRFRSILLLPDEVSDVQCGKVLIDRHILVHVNTHPKKFEALLYMARKLYAFVQGRCKADNADALNNHELLLPGHLFTMILKEKLDEALQGIRLMVLRDSRALNRPDAHAKVLTDIRSGQYMIRAIDRTFGGIGSKVTTFLSTGNIVSSSGLDLMQVSGFTVVAERLNFLRYISHFRAVHRGQFFTTMKTTAVRKLLPECWGFLCPVHTPDGSPCGLLNHLALPCKVIAEPPPEPEESIESVLTSLGVTPAGLGRGDGQVGLPHTYLTVAIDGDIFGGAPPDVCERVMNTLRLLKVSESRRVDPTLEVAYLPRVEGGEGVFPGLYLFTRPARMIRPVLHLESQRVELIGPLEQVFLEVACLPEDVRQGEGEPFPSTHQELDPTNMLSLIAALTPFSDYNQGPRIMYQCQMGKQTMGTPHHSLEQRPDNKMYKVQTPQAPLVQTRRHAEFQMDEYPQGTNAVVAVISYTGYDMEDAMILNKGSYNRGFAHASVYKTKVIDLADEAKASGIGGGTSRNKSLKFSNIATQSNVTSKQTSGIAPDAEVRVYENLDDDGLPVIGSTVSEGEPVCCIIDEVTGKPHAIKHKESEPAFIQTVRAIGPEGEKATQPPCRVSITLRFPRNPIIGDKFSSRHGQKGVMSILWPQQDMPFSESGITPDVIINPHAFPSRMTIGMLLESMAGKSGALHGTFQDATPFSFHEKDRAVDYFGEQLRAAGYSYYGSEPLYSGVSGTVMHADIFIGVVYYQRLRHMVSDKSQVRSIGPINSLTRQPIKGRKRHGGIRLGEMERDALLAHGSSFLLMDRLMNCSDKHIGYVCTNCGSLLSPSFEATTAGNTRRQKQGGPGALKGATSKGRHVCRSCSNQGVDAHCEPLALPYVFRYLASELAGMNIKITLQVDDWKP